MKQIHDEFLRDPSTFKHLTEVAAEVVRLRVVVNRAGVAGARSGDRRRILS